MVDVPVVEDCGLCCVQCGYNLTGLAGCVCPECGGEIDWDQVGWTEESRRVGTPVYRARGWRVVDQTLTTLLSMLVTPWRFAQQVRVDESLYPALCVALASLAIWIGPDYSSGDCIDDLVVFGLAVTVIVMCQALTFATLHWKREFPKVTWRQRFKMWLAVSLYSTCFVTAWRFTDPPIAFPTETNFYWPLSSHTASIGVSMIFYWWWLILAVVLLARNRPRWLAALCIPLVFLFAWIGSWLVVWLKY